MCWDLIAIFIFLKIRIRVDIFGTEKCKVTFGLEYILILLFMLQYLPLVNAISGKNQISERIIWKKHRMLRP